MRKGLKLGCFIGFVLLSTLVSLNSCKKYSSPNKVKRVLTEGRWKVNYLFVDGVDIANQFSEYTFTFAEDGDINVIGEETIDGSWTTDVNKNPTNLILQLTPFLPFNELNADWTLSLLSKDKIQGEVLINGGGTTDILILTPG